MKTIKNLLSTAIRFFKIPTPGLKGFSLIELLVVIGIIGILAAVAIPAYRTYQRDAQASVVESSVNQIKTAVPACLAINDFASCTNATINGTLRTGTGASITATMATQKACWLVTVSGRTACVEFDNDGTGVSVKETLGVPIGIPCKDLKASGCTCATTNTLHAPTGCTCQTGCSPTTGATAADHLHCTAGDGSATKGNLTEPTNTAKGKGCGTTGSTTAAIPATCTTGACGP